MLYCSLALNVHLELKLKNLLSALEVTSRESDFIILEPKKKLFFACGNKDNFILGLCGHVIWQSTKKPCLWLSFDHRSGESGAASFY